MRLRERANIESGLKYADWKIYGTGGATELLHIKPTTLLSRIKKNGDFEGKVKPEADYRNPLNAFIQVQNPIYPQIHFAR